jgi:amino acid transporter
MEWRPAKEEKWAHPSASLKRALRLRDLVLLNIVAVYTPGHAGTEHAARRGGAADLGMAILAFMWPCAAAIANLSRLAPLEGGIYAWTQRSFGDFHGFCVAGATGSTPSLRSKRLPWDCGGRLAAGGERTAWLNENPQVVGLVAIVALWVATLLHVVGLREGAWLQNIGAIGRISMAGAILVAAIWKLTSAEEWRGARVVTVSSISGAKRHSGPSRSTRWWGSTSARR